MLTAFFVFALAFCCCLNNKPLGFVLPCFLRMVAFADIDGVELRR